MSCTLYTGIEHVCTIREKSTFPSCSSLDTNTSEKKLTFTPEDPDSKWY